MIIRSFIFQVLITQYDKQIQQLQEELKEVKDTEVDEMKIFNPL